ncbi:hypothetical protein LTR47_004446 [Exophiala xenobiotica]|nr:hypothetical protein LTR47_004446 [Exophiala xenobiotica]KAK5254886.1 hypothetical protein LTS06_001025 [Exophiala xenobiotica]KAK5352226.1 hypothetical protein LTR61_004477 [Exophiala xenobiotica]KAK5369018.1 hypothetical protein LTR11_007389 [Exophiala xenobiotica]KAK5381154.1 hypothetical protein LTS03_003994 [Exophiala xenobiotica]
MQVVWEADTAAFANRKRAARACTKCRAAKKRCHHTFQRPPEQQADSDGLDRVLPNLTHKEPIRFVGDTNPESILTDLSSRAKGATRISRVGTWVEQSRHPQDDFPPEDLGPPARSCNKTPINVEKYGKFEGGRRVLTGHQRNYLQAVGAFRVLPKATQDALITTYISCLDGLLPILHGPKLLRDWTEGRCSIFLIQAICLVTCKTEEAAPYLRLYDDGPLLDPIPFARSLHTGLDAAMKADLEPDRVTKIQILTLMHLHNDGPGGIEESSLHLSQAIHDAWTAGIHIQTPGRTPRDQASMLWWTIWTLDKFNACLGGRPIMIANRDIDIKEPPLESSTKSQVIHVWLRLGNLLDEVIEFYRPTANPDATGWETDFPSYALLTQDIDLSMLPDGEQNLLEICYHVIAILSCRAGGPTTTSYARRISAADRIQSLVADGRHSSIPPIPLVPYAVGLSLTVVYRALRDNANIDLGRAQADLATRCETLEALSSYWWTADAMARLGRKALKSLQQPGVRKHSVANIQNAMDAEVAMCKFGPFDSKSNAAPNSSLANKKAKTSTDTHAAGNALHVLSDAAATHSNSTTSPGPGQDGSGATRSHHHHGHGQAVTVTATPGSGSGSAPFSSTQTQGRTMTTQTPLPPTTTSDQFGASTADPLNVSTFDQYQYQFNDLDNLFEGFFDLSMPTIFQDPLFDGDAFMNADLGLGFGDEPEANAEAEADHHMMTATTAGTGTTGTELDIPMSTTTTTAATINHTLPNSASGLGVATSRTIGGPGASARGAQRTMYPDIGLS